MPKRKCQELIKTDLRADGWANLLTGIGIKGRDKTAHTTYIADARLEYYELTQIYRGDGIGRRIIDLPVHDMYREWFTIEGDTEGVIEKYLRRLNAKKSLKRAQRWGYLYGGGLAIMGINDGGRYYEPVNENKIKSIEHIHVFDRWRVTLNTADLYVDPDLDKYGKPEYYNIVPIYGAPFRVHESRVLRFEGVDVADQVRIQNQGWGDSIYQSIYARLRGLGESYLNIENILDEFILGILTIDNLQELLASGKEALIQKRLSQIDLSKHIINSVLVDKEEKYDRISSTTTGLEGLMNVLVEAMCAGASIPVCLLMGRSVGGLGSEDASLVRLYYDHIKAQQEEDMLPQINQLVRYINIANKNVLGEEWEIKFKPLWQPTQKDLIATRYNQAQADQIYMANGAVMPEEIALSRFGGDHYSEDTVLSEAHLSELESFKQLPGGDDAVAAEADRQKADYIKNPEDRLGVNKTTDLKTMALSFPKKSAESVSSKSGQMGGSTKDVIAKKQDSADGIDVSGIDLSEKGGLASLNLPVNEFNGYIDASNCNLQSIIGLPTVVNGRVVLNRNKFKNLFGCPVRTEDFHCCSGELVSLDGAPNEVTDFHVHGNSLIDLHGSPRIVKKDFHAYSNKLVMMDGAPQRIAGDFMVNDNNITTLEGLPRYIGRNLNLKGNPVAKLVTEAEIRSRCTVGGIVEL